MKIEVGNVYRAILSTGMFKEGQLYRLTEIIQGFDPCIYRFGSEVGNFSCHKANFKYYFELVSEDDLSQLHHPVNHPIHYNTGKIEVIEAIEDWRLDFCLGNAVKYIARAGKKDPNKIVEDLEKASWYLNRKIQALKT